MRLKLGKHFVIDFSRPAYEKRLFLVNWKTGAAEAFHVSHGRGSAASERSYAAKRFTKLVQGGKLRVLRHQKDAIFGSVCQFLNLETRQCGNYDARPKICRDHPGSVRCGFYDFLCSERELQEDPDYFPSFTRG